MSITKAVCVLLVLIGIISGCGQNSGTAASAEKSPVFDPLAPRYEATLAEGIDFKKPGYPNFLTDANGVSGVESWGRWSDGAVAKFRFKQPLPGKFSLLISASAIGPNLGVPIVVRVGKVEKEFTVTAKDVASTATLAFEGVDGADTLEIIPPKPIHPKDIDPKNEDPRLLGVGLVSIKIQ